MAFMREAFGLNDQNYRRIIKFLFMHIKERIRTGMTLAQIEEELLK